MGAGGAGVAEVVAALDEWELEGEPVLEWAVGELRALVKADKGIAYALHFDEDGHAVSDLWLARVGRPRAPARERMDRWVRSAQGRWSLYSPRDVEQFQRNRPMVVGSWRELTERGQGGEIATKMLRLSADEERRMLESLHDGALFVEHVGIEDDQQLRMLVCEGRTMLAWIGVLQPERFDDEQASAMEAIAPALARRVRMEAALATAAPIAPRCNPRWR